MGEGWPGGRGPDRRPLRTPTRARLCIASPSSSAAAALARFFSARTKCLFECLYFMAESPTETMSRGNERDFFLKEEQLSHRMEK